MATKYKNISTDESCKGGLHTASTQFLYLHENIGEKKRKATTKTNIYIYILKE